MISNVIFYIIKSSIDYESNINYLKENRLKIVINKLLYDINSLYDILFINDIEQNIFIKYESCTLESIKHVNINNNLYTEIIYTYDRYQNISKKEYDEQFSSYNTPFFDNTPINIIQ